jgi:polygalacturonase
VKHKLFYTAVFSLIFCAVNSIAPRSLAAKNPRICDPKSFGAKADGVTKDTANIQAAIDACATTGGTVELKSGIFLTGMITLKSNIDFKIDTGATLKGSQDDADYPDTHPATQNGQLLNCNKTLIYAEGATNLRIIGAGTIDGSGSIPKWVLKERTRPMAIFIVLSNHVTIQDVSVKDAGMWGVVNMETDNLVIQRIHVHTPFGPTRDGIDVVDCHHVLIDSVDVFSEDDAICLKSGIARGVDDVMVSNSKVLQSSVANGLKLGTASTGSFTNITFKNITVQNVDKAALAVESVDGSKINGVHFENIQFHQAGSAIFILLGKRGNPPAVGSIENISFSNVSGDTKHPWGSAISGTQIGSQTYAIHSLSFDNVHVTNSGGVKMVPPAPPEYAGQYPDPNLWGNLPSFGYYFRHVDGVEMKSSTNSDQSGDVRTPLMQEDVANFSTSP